MSLDTQGAQERLQREADNSGPKARFKVEFNDSFIKGEYFLYGAILEGMPEAGDIFSFDGLDFQILRVEQGKVGNKAALEGKAYLFFESLEGVKIKRKSMISKILSEIFSLGVPSKSNVPEEDEIIKIYPRYR